MRNTMANTDLSRRNFLKGSVVALAGAATAGALSACSSQGATSASATSAVASSAEAAEAQTSAAATAATVNMAAGTYTATVDSIKGPMTVTTTVSDSAIQSIVMKSEDTMHVVGHVVDQMIPAMIKNQSTEVDTIAGATFSSAALKRGVRECLDQAGAGDALKENCATQQQQGADETFDAVVVGSGAAGLSSAIQLAKAGKRVVVLERNSYFGGTTSFSSGGVWTVGNTEFNQATGFDFDADGLVKHMYDACEAEQGTLNDALIRKIAAVAPEVYTEYHEAGSPWDTQRYTFGDPLEEMPVSWPGMFYDNAYENSSGMTLIDFMVRHAQENGVDLRASSPVSGLLSEGNKVIGVVVNGREKAYNINADVVVLATGGFQRNPEVVAELAPQAINLVPFTGAGSNGDAIVWGKELGAGTAGSGIAGTLGLNEMIGYGGPLGGSTYITTLRVNKEGKTFMNGAAHYNTYPDALLSQTDGICWGIVGGNGAVDAAEVLVERGYAVKADTLEALAGEIGVPADALAETVEVYNKMAEDGIDDEATGLPAAAMSPATEAPYYAIETHLVSFGVTAGLAADENCNILREDGTPIEGLYGAGEVVVGNIMSGKYTGSGSQIGPAIYEGRIIADAVA